MLTAVKDVVLQMLTTILKAVKNAVYKGHKNHVLRTVASPQLPANTETFPSPSSHSFITVRNGQNLPITCHGKSILPTLVSNFPLHNVLVVPKLVHNLISVRQFTRDNNCSITFDALGFLSGISRPSA
jgi:hypothetical protein